MIQSPKAFRFLKENPKRAMRAFDFFVLIWLTLTTLYVMLLEHDAGFALGLYPVLFRIGISSIIADAGPVKTFFYVSIPYWVPAIFLAYPSTLYVAGHHYMFDGTLGHFIFALAFVILIFPYYAAIGAIEWVYKEVRKARACKENNSTSP